MGELRPSGCGRTGPSLCLPRLRSPPDSPIQLLDSVHATVDVELSLQPAGADVAHRAENRAFRPRPVVEPEVLAGAGKRVSIAAVDEVQAKLLEMAEHNGKAWLGACERGCDAPRMAEAYGVESEFHRLAGVPGAQTAGQDPIRSRASPYRFRRPPSPRSG